MKCFKLRRNIAKHVSTKVFTDAALLRGESAIVAVFLVRDP
jgi:hypothetical protein